MSVRVCTLANGAVGTVATAPKRAVVVEWCGAVAEGTEGDLAAAAGEVVAAGAEAGTVTAWGRAPEGTEGNVKFLTSYTIGAGVVATVAPAGRLGGGAAARPGTLPPLFLV